MSESLKESIKKVFGSKDKSQQGTHEGINVTSGNSNDFTSALSTALGTLLTGDINIDDEKKAKQGIKGKGKPDPRNKGILGLLASIDTRIANIATGKDGVFQSLKSYLDNNKKEGKNVGGSQGKKAIDVSGNSDFAMLLDSISRFELSDETKEALESFAEMTSSGGSIHEMFENIKKLDEMDVDFDSFEKKMQKINKTSAETAAVEGKIKSEDVKRSNEAMRGLAMLFMGVAALAVVFALIGLIAKYIDYGALAMFSATLMIFLAGLMLVFVIAHKKLTPKGDVMQGLKEFGILVGVSAGVLILGSMLIRLVQIPSLILFTVTLHMFLSGIMDTFAKFAKVYEEEDLSKAIKNITHLIMVSSIILVLGSIIISFINPVSLILFTVTLGLFIFGILSVFALSHKIFKDGGGMDGMKDAVFLVVGSAFIMFIGAAVMPMLNIKNLFLFTFTLGVFLFVILGIFKILHLTDKKEPTVLKKGEKAVNAPSGMKDALFLVVGSAFMLFLGAAVMPMLNYGNLILFVVTLAAFIWAVLTPYLVLKPVIADVANTAKMVALLVLVSGLMLLSGGWLIMKNPWLALTIPVFILYLVLFINGVMDAFLTLPKEEIIITLEKAKAISLIVAVCGGMLLIAGKLIADNMLMALTIPLFGLYLAILLNELIKIFQKIKINDISLSLAKAKAMALLVAVCGGMLLIGGGLIAAFPALGWAIPLWGVLLGLFILGMVGIIKLLSNIKEGDLVKAGLAILAISGASVAMAGTFMILGLVLKQINGWGGLAKFGLLVLMMCGSMVAMAFSIKIVALALGNPVTYVLALSAVAVLLAFGGAMALVSLAMLNIAEAIERMSKIESFDPKPLISGIDSILLILKKMAPLSLVAPFLLIISDVMLNLTDVMSKMAEAVKEYADLKIRVYQGTKVVGYRQLEKRDFKAAATNVSLLVTTLTEGIMQAYHAHPDWYGAGAMLGPAFAALALTPWTAPFALAGALVSKMVKSPLEQVIKQSKMLAGLINKIADAVKDYADLKIGMYEGTKLVGYRRLTKSDFKSAATNISLIVSVLTEGIMQVYTDHPDWYAGSSFISNSPLENVIKTNKKLSKLISEVAAAIKDYADLKIPTKWNEQGQAVGFRNLKANDFKNAGKNVSKVLVTMMNGIMDVYEEHKDWYAGSSWITNSPAENVIKTNEKLSKLISKVAESIKDYADLKIPTKWDKDGKVIGFRTLKNGDFNNAGNNISNVLVTITNGIMNVYDDHPDWYKGGGLFSSSPMEKVIKTDEKLSKLISNVAASIKDYAQLMIPDKWDKEGKAIHYREMKPEEFGQAGKNIGDVITTTAMGIMGYSSDGTPNEFQPLIQKYMIDGDEDDFNKIVDNAVKIGSLVSGLADGISKYAQMLVPDKWDKEGKPIHYVQMSSDMMSDAATGVATVIMCVANALTGLWEDPQMREIFGWDPEEEEFKSDAPLKHVIDACVNMGSVVSGIAEGIQQFADLKIPKKWDKNGKPIDFDKLDSSIFISAATNVSIIMMTLADTFQSIYYDHPELWTIRMKKEGGFLCFGGQEVPAEQMSPFERVVDASVKMATVIGTIAEALQLFADKKVIGKNDEVIAITDTTIKLAQQSITQVLITIADTFKKLAGPNYKQLFGNKNLIENIVEPVGAMTEVVSNLAIAIQNMAMLKIPTKWDKEGKPIAFSSMKSKDFEAAGNNIKRIISAVGEAFLDIATKRNEWLDQVIEVNRNGGIGSYMKTKDAVSGEGIGAMLEGMATLANILNVMAGNLYGYATLRFPRGTDKDGNTIYSRPLKETEIKKAEDNIKMVALVIANAVLGLINDTTISSLKEKSKEIEKSADAIVDGIDVLTSIVEGINDMMQNEAIKNINSLSKRVSNAVTPLTSIVDNIATILKLFFGGDADKYGSITATATMFEKEITIEFSFADIIKQYNERYAGISQIAGTVLSNIESIVDLFVNLETHLSDTKPSINRLNELFVREKYLTKMGEIVASTAGLVSIFQAFNSFEDLFENTKTMADESFGEAFVDTIGEVFTLGLYESGHEKLDIGFELNKLLEKITLYSDFISKVLVQLIKIGSLTANVQVIDDKKIAASVSGFFSAVRVIKTQLSNSDPDHITAIGYMIHSYAKALNELIVTSAKASMIGANNFDALINGVVQINNTFKGINVKSLLMFKLQNAQLSKFVKTVNTIKLWNLINLNQFVNSLNRLANKMGNLDKLTDAIANKLAKVLDKLVSRLVHAENTIIKADEIQNKRHQLIEQSVNEVSNLMKQPMVVEIKNVTPTPETETTTTSTTTSTDTNTTNKTT